MGSSLSQAVVFLGRVHRARLARQSARSPAAVPPVIEVDATRTPVVFAGPLFREALLRECRRSDRGGGPFLVLLLEAGGTASADSPTWPALMRALTAARRPMDAIGWFETGKVLGLLIPDVADNLAAARLVQAVRRELAGAFDGLLPADVSVRVYAHGAESWPDGSPFPTVGLLLEALRDADADPRRDRVKRLLDIVGSTLALVAASPVLAALFVLVRWTSPGPALFRQERIGQRGKPFMMLKFRTMVADNDPRIHEQYVAWFIASSDRQARTGDETYKIKDDPRVTRLGRILRRTSLDELPQFWNVLRGDMSLVGPRPPLRFEVDRYQPWHRRRVLDAKPGITGLWQVKGRSRTTFDEMVRLDLRYARTRSLWTDLRILAATPRAVITGKGAM